MGSGKPYSWDRALEKAVRRLERSEIVEKKRHPNGRPPTATAITAESELPEEMRPVFRQLLEDYKAAAKMVHGTSFNSPTVIAELVRLGWRCPEAMERKS